MASEVTAQMSQQYGAAKRAGPGVASIDAGSVFGVAMVAMGFRYAARVNKLLISARIDAAS